MVIGVTRGLHEGLISNTRFVGRLGLLVCLGPQDPHRVSERPNKMEGRSFKKTQRPGMEKDREENYLSSGQVQVGWQGFSLVLFVVPMGKMQG